MLIGPLVKIFLFLSLIDNWTAEAIGIFNLLNWANQMPGPQLVIIMMLLQYLPDNIAFNQTKTVEEVNPVSLFSEGTLRCSEVMS